MICPLKAGSRAVIALATIAVLYEVSGQHG